jgi:hypothetical protein
MLRIYQTSAGTDSWSVYHDGEDQPAIKIRLTPNPTGNGRGQYMITGRDSPELQDPFVDEGTFAYDVWSVETARDLVSKIVRSLGHRDTLRFEDGRPPSCTR